MLVGTGMFAAMTPVKKLSASTKIRSYPTFPEEKKKVK